MFEHTRDYERRYPALSPVVCIILLLEGSHLLHAPLSPMLLQQRSPMHCCTSLPTLPIQQGDITSFHRVIEWLGLEGTPRSNPFPQAGPPTSRSGTRPGCPGPHPTWSFPCAHILCFLEVHPLGSFRNFSARSIAEGILRLPETCVLLNAFLPSLRWW